MLFKVNVILKLFVCLFFLSNICFGNPNTSASHSKSTIKILTIDGGGIRGIIPIKILAYLESRLNSSSITNHFNIMSGTSAGGIIVLLLNIPNNDNTPRYSAQSLYPIFKKLGQNIFERSLFYKIITLNGWVGPKYKDEALIFHLNLLMENYTILNTVKDVIISAYDLIDEKNYFFRKAKAYEKQERVFYLKDIARATSAAPTYFNPIEIYDIYKINKHLMVDGGVSVNNPALSALVYAFSQYGINANYIVISIGTGSTLDASKSKIDYYDMNVKQAGKLQWASNIIPLLMDSVNDVTDYQMQQLLGKENYYRLQVTIDPEHSALDDISLENIKALEQYADEFIKNNQQLLNQVIDQLK